jgi:hypothetical protein
MQQQPQQQQPQYQAIGHIATLDNKRQFKPLRVSFVEASGQVRWFSAFEGVGKSLEAGGEGSGPWTLTYSEKPYVSATGSQGVNLNIRQAVLNGQAAQPQAQPQVQVQAPAQQMPVAEFIPNAGTAPAWSLNMDDRGRAIIRQVAFKAAADIVIASGIHANTLADIVRLVPEHLAAMTDISESIILGTYQPEVFIDPEPEEAPPPSDEEFIQHTL